MVIYDIDSAGSASRLGWLTVGQPVIIIEPRSPWKLDRFTHQSIHAICFT